MKSIVFRCAVIGALLSFASFAAAATHRVDFEGMGLDAPDSYDNGSDLSGGFLSADGYAFFGNQYHTDHKYWEGFALSRVSDTNTPGTPNQYAVWTPGTGRGGSGAYAVAFPGFETPTAITFSGPVQVRQIYLNNTTYVALSMLNGDNWAKKFGGADGTDPDWFKVTITGRDARGAAIGSVDFYLGDFRPEDPSQDYIVSDWTRVDLSSLGDRVVSLEFSFSGSDMSYGYLNTPTYVALDDLEYIPAYETLDATFDTLPTSPGAPYFGPQLGDGFTDLDVHFGNTDSYGYCMGFSCSSVCDTNTAGFRNQYAVWMPGHDLSTNGNYAVYFDGGVWSTNEITFPRQAFVPGFHIANTTYAALTMLNGSGVTAKKFGGDDGTDPDWLKVTIAARDACGNPLGTIDAYLADYRFDDSDDDYILSDWTWVDLSSFGPAVKALSFTLSGSDTGQYGLNTPAYFAMDGLEYAYSFSDPTGTAAGNGTDAPIPGYCGSGIDGAVDDAGNGVNPAFAAWAGGVSEYAPTADVLDAWKDTTRALGPATGDAFDVVSLGDLSAAQIEAGDEPGTITLTFPMPITDKAGPDFAVFENGFVVDNVDNRFSAELGYVEVSSDGIHFTRFPAAYLHEDLDISNGRGYASLDSRYVYNLCGKHANSYDISWGTPFDLAELADSADAVAGTLDLSAVTHVRIVDIPGDGSRTDAAGRPISDAWVTWGSGGVDLDAVGVLNSSGASRIDVAVSGNGSVSPLGKPANYVSVPHGTNVTFTFAPAQGHLLAAVLLDGVEQPVAGNGLTLENLQADHAMTVVFLDPNAATSQGVPYAWLLSTGAMDPADGVDAVQAEAAAAADPDGDGQPTWAEYFGGTDPLDGAESLRIVGVSASESGTTVTWLGGTHGSDLPFEVLVRTDLAAGAAVETNEIPVRSSTGTNSWTHAVPASGSRFYGIRVKMEP